MSIEQITAAHMSEAQDISLSAIEEQEVAAQIRKTGLVLARVKQLVQSISTKGLQKPIVVEQTDTGGYRVINGNHRLEAHRQLERNVIPAIIREFDSEIAERLFQANENDHDPSTSNSDKDLTGVIHLLAEDELSKGRLNLKDSKSRQSAKKRIAKKVHEACKNNHSLASVETLVKNYFKNQIPSQGFKNWTSASALEASKEYLGWLCESPKKSGMLFEDLNGDSQCIFTIDPRNCNTDVYLAYAMRKKLEDPSCNITFVLAFDTEKIQFRDLSGSDSLEYRRREARNKLATLNKVKITHPSTRKKMSLIDDLYFLPQLKDGDDAEDLKALIASKV